MLSSPSLARVRGGTYGQGTAEAWPNGNWQIWPFSGNKDKPKPSKASCKNYVQSILEITEMVNRFKAGKIDINGRKAQFYGQFDGLIITAAMSEFVKYRRD